MEFSTRHLEIKKFIPEYIPTMYSGWGTDREVGRYMPGFRTEWNLEEFTEYILKTYNDENHTRSIIKEKGTNSIIGNISIYQEDSRSKSVNIWLIKEYWNKGYGTEALEGIVKVLKEENLYSIYATCDGRNLGAMRMLEKANFELIDKIKDYREDIDGNVGDEILYEIELKKWSY